MLGITIFPEYIQSEGSEALLDNLLERFPLTAVSISPYVMEECPPEKGGEREPPADSDKGLARLLDRPLWGKREVWVTAAPSFTPDLSLYQGLRYQPQEPTDLTRREGKVIAAFIAAAHDRNIKVYFQIQAAIPPGYRVQFGGPEEDDMPRLPDGSIPKKSLDNNGSIASPHILAYSEALIRDLLTQYPDIDGLRVDWPEYPPYFLETIFLDFSHHAKQLAKENGFDFETMRREAGSLYQYLTEELNDHDLETYLKSPEAFLDRWTGCREWLQFKTFTVSNLLARFYKTVNDVGGPEKAFIPSAFPPPWNFLSGFDYASASEHCTAVSCKFYTMHWPMMLINYSDSLTRKNPGLSKQLLAACLAKAFEAASPIPDTTDDFNYPEPDERHPVDLLSLSRKFKSVLEKAKDTPIWPLAHSYGPIDDFTARANAVLAVSKDRLWINRYAYLSDKKLDALAELIKKS